MDIDLGGVSVFLGMPVNGRVPAQTALSLAHTALRCGAGGVDLSIDMEQRGTVHWARDAIFDAFLRSGRNKLFWVDADMVWEPDAFLRLVALSTKRDIVCAAYPSRRDGDDPGFKIAGMGRVTTDEFGLMEIAGLGLGFAVMDRSVCETLAARTATSFCSVTETDMHDAFRFDAPGGVRRGEDIAFFADLRALGFKVHLDPTITLGHVGEKVWTGRLLDMMKRIDQ